MSSVKIVKCVVREADPGLINGEITYEVSFSDTEVRLNLGFIPTLSVQPSSQLTAATKTVGVGVAAVNNSRDAYRKVVSIALKPVRPEGQLVMSRTETFQVAKDSLFIDLSDFQVGAEQRTADYFSIAPWTKATAWNPITAGLDAWIDLSLDIGPSRADSSDLRFVNRVPPAPLTAVTTTTRTPVVGGPGGTAFEDTIPPNTIQLNRLLVRTGNVVYSIRAEWKSSSGQLTLGAEHGGADASTVAVSSCQECVFDQGEYITQVSGAWGQQNVNVYVGTSSPDGPVVVRRLQFMTSSGRRIGPFGYSSSKFETPFSFTGLKVVGFFGRSSSVLDQLGVISRADGQAGTVAGPVVDTTDDLKGSITARGDNGANEGKEKAFDNQSGSKWLDFYSAQGTWIQYAYAAGSAGRLTGYSITSANDTPERDPADFQLLGSNDGGWTFTTVDSRTGITFRDRFQKQTFALSGSPTFKAYRLNITKVQNSAAASCLQIADIELLGQLVSAP